MSGWTIVGWLEWRWVLGILRAMNAVLDTLPDDIEALKQLVLNQRSALAEASSRIGLLEELVRLYKHRQFGTKSEQQAPGQTLLFNEAEAEALKHRETADDPADAPAVEVPAHLSPPV